MKCQLRRSHPFGLVLLLILPAAAPAATIRVDDAGNGDFVTIQEGLDAASTGDTVLVAAGTYTGAQNRDLDTGGKGVVLRSETGPEGTVIDCQGAGRAFYIHLGEDRETVINGFTVTGGAAFNGGAVLLFDSGPTLENCVFTDNVGSEGGAIHAAIDSAPDISDCTFSNNWAYDYGGAIYTYRATPYVSHCQFTGNAAGISGGGISLKTGTVARIYDCTFTGNSADDGGGVYIGVFSDVPEERDIPEASVMSFCRFFGNTGTRGAGLFVNALSWSLCTYSTFAHNTATDGGGIFVLSDLGPTLSVQYCTIVLNEAEYGGGIYAAGGDDQYQPGVATSIIAFNFQGEAVFRQSGAPVDVDKVFSYGNEGGNELIGTRIKYVDPLFCGLYSDDFRLCETSLCRQVNNEWRYLIGATSQYCVGPCTSPVQALSWGAIKAMYR